MPQNDPINGIYNDLKLKDQGVDYAAFKSKFESTPELRKSVFNDLGLESAGISYDTYKEKLGFKKKVRTKPSGKSTPSGSATSSTGGEGDQKLTKTEEVDFRKWYGNLSKKKDLSSNPDDPLHYYDYRSFWKNEPKLREGILKEDADAHFIDKYKMPGHPTFSNESIYSTKETPGGSWSVDENGKNKFTHSKYTSTYKDKTNEYLKGTGEYAVDAPIGGEGDPISKGNQSTYSVKPDEGPLRKGKPTTVNVGGKDFDIEPQKDLTSFEVNQTAKKLFKEASPVSQSKKQAISDHPAMQGIVKNVGESAFENLSPKVLSGNEDILSAYINKLPEDEQNRLRGRKFNEEESYEILSNAYRPLLEQSVQDLSILRQRGVEDDLKIITDKQKQIQTLSQGIESDKNALVNLQSTFLKQKGYDNLANQYQELNKQLKVKQKEVAPILQQKQEIENELGQFDALIKDGQFLGNKQEYDAYTQLMDQYNAINESAELSSFNKLIGQQNEIVKSINGIVTPEFREQEQKLTDKLNGTITSIQTLQKDLGEYVTPEKQEQLDMYGQALDVYNGINDKLQSVKSKMPDLVEKKQVVDALNLAVGDNPALKGYDLAAKAFGGFTEAVGSMLSSVPKFAGGLSNEYSFSDKAAESITDFFAPKTTTTQTKVAGEQSTLYKPFYDAQTDIINWGSLPDEIANQIGAFAVLAGTGTLGGMAKMSDAVSIVLPGTMLTYNDAYQTGREIYGDDAMSATAYASASSLITGITELIMPDRDILSGGMVDGLAKNYVKNYVRKGKRYAVEQSMLSLTEMMGKEVGEEFADRWKDVLLKGVVNVTGGDTEYDIPTVNEQLSIAASTAALTGAGGISGQIGKNSKARKLAVYEAAKNYPETLTMLQNMEEVQVGKEEDRIASIKAEVTDMFMALKEVPTNLSAPKRIAIAEKIQQAKFIEDQMSSGISPMIVDKMKDSIKEISNEIQAIILDENYDKTFAEEVNEEVQPTETPKSESANRITEGVTVEPIKEEVLKEPTAKDVKDDIENGRTVSFRFENIEDIPKVLSDNFEYANWGWDKERKRPKYFTINMTETEAKYYTSLAKGLPTPEGSKEGVIPTPTPEGTQEGITPTQNEQEVNQEGQGGEELLSQEEKGTGAEMGLLSAPASSESAVTQTEEKIKAANERIDAASNWLKEKLKIDTLPKDTKRSGIETDRLIDLMASGVKHLVSKGIKTSEAIKQVVEYMKEGKFLPKNYNSMVNKLWSKMDAEMEKLWVDSEYKLTKDENGALYVRTVKGKEVSRKIRKEVINKYVDQVNFDKGKRAVFNEGITEDRANEHIADTSKNPAEILEALAGVGEKIKEEQLDNTEVVLADLLLSKVSTDSFIDASDANLLDDEKGKLQEGGALRINYLRKNGKSIDLIAQEASEIIGMEVTPEDVVNFMLKYPKGVDSFWNQKSPDYTMLAGAFFDLTGLHPTQEMIDRVVNMPESDESFAGLEPAEKTDEMGQASEPKRKKRKFTKNLMGDESVSGTMKALAKENAIYYLVQKNVMSVAEANSIIQEAGIDAAEALAKDFNNDINGGVRAVLIQTLIKKHEANGNPERADELFEFATEKFTDAGQFIQAAYLWGKLTPEGQIRQAKREVEKQINKRVKLDKSEIERTKKAVKKTVKESIDEALVSTGVETAAQVIDEKSYGSKNKIITKDKYKAALAKFRAKGGMLSANPFKEEIIPITIYHAEAAGREFGKFARRMTRDLGAAIKPYLRELYEKAKSKAIEDGANAEDFASADDVSAYYADQQISKIEGAVKKGLKELNKKIADVARAHYTEYDATKSQLADKLVAEADLNPADAKRLADAIKKEFDRIFEKKKKDMLKAIVKEKPIVEKKIKHIDQLSEDLLKLVNLGGFSDAEFLSAWAKANGYPELTEENIKEIKRLADIVESFKDEGFEKLRAIEDLLAYQARIKNINRRDIAQALWYASVLSGFQTQFVNIASNAWNTIFEYGVQSIKDRNSMRFMAKGWWDGFVNGILREAPEVWKSGYNPIRGKVEIPATLEIIGKGKSKYHIYNMAKMVRRMMVATDVIFYEGLREMRAYQLANSMAKEDQKNNPSIELINKAIEILNKNDEFFQAANNAAELEYKAKLDTIDSSGLSEAEKKRLIKQAEKDKARRVHEIMVIERGDTFNELTRRFAAKGTFNYPPEGLLGQAARWANQAANSVPAIRYIIPFTSIIANVANETLNYTPYGALRATLGNKKGGHLLGTRKDGPLTQDERADLLIKASIGVAFMTTVMMMTGGGDDGEDPLMEITGGATGDFKKNYNLKDWQKYSFRVKNPVTGEYGNWISYQQITPLFLPLAYIGNLRDLEKYRGEKMDESTFLKYRSALTNTKTLFFDMTFLAGANQFLNDMVSGDTDFIENLTKSTLNIGKGFIPNLYNQSFKQMQEWKEIPIKETTLQFDRPKTWMAPYLKDIPIARNIYYDKIDALGDPIIPNPDKFIKDKEDIPLAWQHVAEFKMTNLGVPSIKVMKDVDPVPDKNGEIRETAYTEEEYYNFCKYRGEIIKMELEYFAPVEEWRVENEIKKGSGDALAKKWMTSTLKKATDQAKEIIYKQREIKAYGID